MRLFMHRKILSLAACLLLLAGAFGLDARAQQSASATLTGVVTDPAGAVVPGVTVSVVERATGATRETKTNDEGLYVLSNLSPGEYEIRAEGQGFARKVSKVPVVLQVGQNVSVDIHLEIGSLGEIVNLLEFTPQIDTTASKVDRVIGVREIENLPLNGRNFLELALLTPGNSPAPNFDPTKTNTLVISSAGQLGRGGSVTVDGADNNDDVVGGAVQNISQDAVREFQIATNRFDARLGRSASSVVNVVTKSGTNEFHGSLFAYLRDDKLQGLPATFDRTGTTGGPPFDRQQYSATLGGPIKKDVAFFFGSVEFRNQDGAVLVGTRDTAARTIRRGFADAPLDDLLSTERLDWRLNDRDWLTFRYSLQREENVSASTLIRSIGSASQGSQQQPHAIFSGELHAPAFARRCQQP